MNDINRLISQQCPSAVSFGSVAKVPCRMYQLIINEHKIFDDSCRFYNIYQYAISRLLCLFKKCIIIIYILCIDCAKNNKSCLT